MEVFKTKFTSIRNIKTKEVYFEMYKDYTETLGKYNPEIATHLHRYFADSYLKQAYGGGLTVHLIELDNGEIIGFTIIGNSSVEGYVPPDTDWFIHEFYIKPEYRRNGYGIEAVKTFQKTHTGKVGYFILRKNTPALSFWEKAESVLGWKRLDASLYNDSYFVEDDLARFFVSDVGRASGVR